MDTSSLAIDRYWSFLPQSFTEAAACGSARGRQGFQGPLRHGGASRKPTPELPDMVFDLDLLAGLRRAGGDRCAYVELLRRFGRGQRSFAIQVKEPLAREDWATAERVVHGCALAAERIGARHLASRAQALEEVLKTVRQGGQSTAQLKPLVREVTALAQGLAMQLHVQLTLAPAGLLPRHAACAAPEASASP